MPWLPFSAFLGSNPLLSSRVFWRVYTLLTFFFASWRHSTAFLWWSSGGHTLFSFSVFHGPMPLNIFGVLWRPYS